MYTKFPAYVLREDGACIPMDERNADYQAYLEWIAQGNVPSDPPQPTLGELILRAIAEIRLQRQPIIEILDGLQASSLTKGEASRAQVIETAKQGLRDLTNIDLTACATYADMRLKVKAAYFALAAALPSDLRQAFKDAIS
ncbi:hypothetical protein QFZ42_003307 [Variovorax paradoxus]|uniref:hypothetical protein n=1 Tax=Variovorax paradoxus TaxID=34073 RepID=UPI0027922F46|nr:hypothetical protein [Variovorax paradoxus]MDQ0571473.1 hypothetical protein [Variovorax paradoxus]